MNLSRFGMVLFLILFVAGLSISPVSANPGEIVVHTCNTPKDVTSLNGISFNDNQWSLAFVAGYRLTFEDEHFTVIKTVAGTMGVATKDNTYTIPATTKYISIFADCGGAKPEPTESGSNRFIGKYVLDNDTLPSELTGALIFDGTTAQRNFHAKINKGSDTVFDSDYIRVSF